MSDKQWYMEYFDITIENKPNDETKTTIRFKKNKFTGSVYLFTYHHPYKENGHTWNECGYGYGAWIRIN